ncbi:MAG: hypothetical protein H6Q90_4820 [Deltaproteobacteria bacterium]|nr:hypothetical protein [Deltaproteobacteria bacterium]
MKRTLVVGLVALSFSLGEGPTVADDKPAALITKRYPAYAGAQLFCTTKGFAASQLFYTADEPKTVFAFFKSKLGTDEKTFHDSGSSYTWFDDRDKPTEQLVVQAPYGPQSITGGKMGGCEVPKGAKTVVQYVLVKRKP